MSLRANYYQLAKPTVDALIALDQTLADSPLEPAIVDLVKIRTSQLNGCIFCVDAHTKEARLHGDRELRMHHLPFWRESVLFTAKEKAALEWTELVTRPGVHGIEDSDYEKMRQIFSEKELTDLTFVIASMNTWNRVGIVFRPAPGSMDKMKGLDKIGLS